MNPLFATLSLFFATLQAVEAERHGELAEEALYSKWEELTSQQEDLFEADHKWAIAMQEKPTRPLPRQTPAPVEQEDIFRVEIGANYTHASIKLRTHAPFHGNLGGAQGIFEYRPWNNFYGALSLKWKEGTTKSSHGSRKLLYIDLQERLGYTYACDSRNWLFSLFTGLGYRHIWQHLHESGQGLRFAYNELYIPLGFASDYMFSTWFSGGLNFVWMPQVYPTVKITPLKGARWILESSLNNFLVEFPLTFYVTRDKLFSIVVKPFYEYWQDGHSTAKTATGEKLGLPGNDYNFWGVDLNLGLSF